MTSYYVRVQFEDGSSVSWVFTDEESARQAIAQAVAARVGVTENSSYAQPFMIQVSWEDRP